MKVLFMGTPDFAVPSLKMLLKKHEVCAVVTQPDRPKGRGKKMVPPIIKEIALEHGILVYQPEKVKESGFIEKLKELDAEIIVVVAFGQILSEEILNMPKYGCVNVHGSLLPKYRGAGPIQWAVINGDKETGVTTMMMAKGLDSGDMLLKRRMEIQQEDTYGTLHDRMALVGAEVLEETLELIEKGQAVPIAQKETEMSIAPMITKETEKIIWSKTSKEILCLIRGLSPVPGAYTNCGDEILKIWDAEDFKTSDKKMQCGQIIDVTKRGFIVKTGDGSLLITQLQARGGKKMSTDAYMRGHHIEKGMKLQ